MFYPLNYPSVCRPNKIRTCISSSVVKYSDPLNYRPSWLTPGIEPCSPQPQCGALPNKLEPTFEVGVGFEPTSSDSNSEMLPLHHPTISNLYGTRTHITRMKILGPNRLDEQIWYSRQDSNLHPLRSRRSIQPIGMLLYFGGIAATFSYHGLMVIHFGKASAFRRNAYSLLSAPNALVIL
jgi:hypothetical protein